MDICYIIIIVVNLARYTVDIYILWITKGFSKGKGKPFDVTGFNFWWASNS